MNFCRAARGHGGELDGGIRQRDFPCIFATAKGSAPHKPAFPTNFTRQALSNCPSIAKLLQSPFQANLANLAPFPPHYDYRMSRVGLKEEEQSRSVVVLE